MVITYELKPITTRGVLMFNSPSIISDRDLFLKFKCEKTGGQYFIAITSQNGEIETIYAEDMQIKIPERFVKTQTIKVRAINLINGKAEKQWDCQPLQLTVLNDIIKTTHLADVDYKALQAEYVRIAEDVESLLEKNNKNERDLREINLLVEAKQIYIKELEKKLNEAIVAINNLSERIEFMENNYNPLEV